MSGLGNAPPVLDPQEKRVLELLVQQGRYYSSIVLAADVFDTSVANEEPREFEWWAIENILEGLNLRGLVVYKIGSLQTPATPARNARFVEGRQLFVSIRATPAAYRLLGIDRLIIREINRNVRHHMGEAVRKREDRTDFRLYDYDAVPVGPLVREDFIDHCYQDCDHLDKHRAQLRELYGTDEV